MRKGIDLPPHSSPPTGAPPFLDRAKDPSVERKMRRALRTLSRCNRAIARARNETDLLYEICRIIVEHGYLMAWIGFAETDAERSVRVAAYHGFEVGYLERARISWGDNERGRGPTGTAIRTGKATACRDFMTDPLVEPWREDAIRRGYHSSLTLPLLVDGKAIGALNVYAAEAFAFDFDEVELLEELADDLAWSITSLRERSIRQQAEQALAASEARIREFIEHTPAAVALFDRDMRLVQVSRRWLVDYRLEGKPVLGQTIDEVFPAISERWTKLFQRVLDGAIESGEEDAFQREDGSTDWLQWELRPWRMTDGSIGGLLMMTQVISERVAARQAIEQHRKRASAILEWASDGIIGLDASHRIVVFNRAAERMFGCAREDAIGRTIDRFLPGIPGRPPAPRGADFGDSGLSELAIGEASALVGRREDGTEFPVEASVSLNDLYGEALATVTCRDLTEQRKAELSLRDSEERLRTLTEHLHEVVWLLDLETHRMLYVSTAYERIWGRSCEALYRDPSSWRELVHPDDRISVAMAIAAMQGTGHYDAEYRIVRDDGAVVFIRERGFPIMDSDGQVRRVAGVAEDVTERRRIEEQLRNAQKMEAIGQLAGGVAHDFNNILAAILMQSELASHLDEATPKMRRILGEIGKSAERGAGLTRQLLQFSRQQVMQPVLVDVNEIIRSIVVMLERLLPADVPIDLELSPSPCLVHADPGMIEQVVMNLVVNARDAMPNGGVIKIETGRTSQTDTSLVSTGSTGAGSFVFLRVTDRGSGISPEIVSRIFDPFFTTKEKGKGTGLGLATVFGIVQQHRGTISVKTAEGRGTTFEVLLPEREASTDERVRDTVSPRPRTGIETILLAEDDPMLRGLTREALERAGYRVIEAESGVDALKAWANRDGRIDLLATDLVMPEGLGGGDLASLLQSRDPSLKVVMFSGYSSEVAGRALSLGEGQRFLQKPFSTTQLLEAVRACLDS